MTSTTPVKLPPMTALEYAIANTFRHFFFGLWLALLWLIVLLPFIVAAYHFGLRNGLPDLKALPPAAMASFAALGLMVLLASVSVAVNWHRRLVLGERPRGLAWIRLNGVVWRYLLMFLFILFVMGAIAGAIFAVRAYVVPALVPGLASAAEPAGIVVSALLGLFGLFTWYRLSTRLPAIASGDRDCTLAAAWRATRNNRLRFLAFTFWLLFSLAIAAGIGAGAYFGQQAAQNVYVTAAAFLLIALLSWLTLFFVITIATSHYVCFARREESKAE